jgi:hypothetical protein
MTSATVSAPAPTGYCPECREPVLRAGPLLLAPELVAGGLYGLGHGVAKRRPLTHIADEVRLTVAVHGGGFDPHECPLPIAWIYR